MDKKLKELINKEIKRQQTTIDLIASENVADLDTLKIVGSPLMNKYSEGYPDKRYYPGNQYYDEIEKLSWKYALEAFSLNSNQWGVNTQPYSGSPANQAIYFALLQPGDTIMGLALAHGGHLSHGLKVNFSGKYYRPVFYTLNEKTGYIDYDNFEKLALEHKPQLIISGASAYPREINFKKIGVVAKKIGAYHLADISHVAGLIAAGLHQSPFPYADVVMTTTHKTLRGPRAAVIFSKKELSSLIDRAVFPGIQAGPHNNVTAAIAEMFSVAKTSKFKSYQKQVIKNAETLAKELMKHGFKLLTDGTDNHLMLLDLRNKNITGGEAQDLLEKAGIIANKNVIPGDEKPSNPSGIRFGTPATTSRGFKEKEMKRIAEWIYKVIDKKGAANKIQKEVVGLCKKFPLKYKHI